MSLRGRPREPRPAHRSDGKWCPSPPPRPRARRGAPRASPRLATTRSGAEPNARKWFKTPVIPGCRVTCGRCPRDEECECRSHVEVQTSRCPGVDRAVRDSGQEVSTGLRLVRNLGRSACGASGRDVGRPRAQVVGQRSAPWAVGVRGGELGVVRRRSRYVPTRTALPPSPRKWTCTRSPPRVSRVRNL